MTVLRTFNDDASTLPEWSLNPEIVNPRTEMVAPQLPATVANMVGVRGDSPFRSTAHHPLPPR